MMILKIKLEEGATRPTRGYGLDAGYDLYARVDTVIPPRGITVLDTGVHAEIPPGYCGKICSKSGMMKNGKITSDGLIDAGYTGSIHAIMFNHSDSVYKIKAGEKIAQMVIIPCCTPVLVEVDEICGGERGSNGFGSTGR